MKKLEIVIVNVAMAISMLALFFLFTHKELSEQEPLLSSYENRERMQTLQSDESRLIESLVKPREDSTIEKKKSPLSLCETGRISLWYPLAKRILHKTL